MGKRASRVLSSLAVTGAVLLLSVGPGSAQSPAPPNVGDAPTLRPGTTIPEQNDDQEAKLLALDQQFISTRTAGDVPLTVDQAVALRKAAADQAKLLTNSLPAGPTSFGGSWSALGPNPIRQIQRSDNALTAESGRIGALLILPSGRFVLGAAQGGVWTSDDNGHTWTARTETLASTATGALAYAPSNPNVVYDGTGEGALSGDSYFGNGILKSIDGGTSWSHVSGDFFFGVSTARLAVDPQDQNHVYAAILRGRGGDRRVSPPIHSTFGIWESHDGGVNWTLLKAAPKDSLGATEVRLDPKKPSTLYSSFWGDKIYKSVDGGASWNPIMSGLPAGNFAALPTRFSIGISHPASDAKATLYTGFDWVDATTGKRQLGHIFKSTDEGASWQELPTGTAPFDTVLDYCTTQCFYDNVVEPDPTDPNIVFVAGSFGYSMPIPSGGVFRSDDGGQTWKNIGWDMHPDFHALAFDPNNSANLLIGNDGGVWYSTSRGGRTASESGPCPASPLSAAATCLNNTTWQDKNGGGLQISQFTSIAVVPTMIVAPGAQSQRFWGGTQDNGTLRKSVNSKTWFDMSSGDGGQVMVDQTDQTSCPPAPGLPSFGACFVYGTYFGVSLYRFQDGGAGFFSNAPLTNGINTSDRSEFYIPVALNQQNTNQLFTATYRLYRTDNAKADAPGDVHFNVISPDLTSGCTGPAPNGARACVISAIGIGGGTGVYIGTDDGRLWFSPNAMISTSPTWIREDNHSNGVGDKHSLPNRPIAWIAVDQSNDRIAYAAYNGYNAATPHQPGHVFKTTDGGQTWSDISGNLPDNPVNSLTLDPSFPNTLYAATDVGPFVTYDSGAHWGRLGTGFPAVAVDQIDLDSYDRVIGAGTHGLGAYQIQDTNSVPSLVLSKVDSGVPVGPGSTISYTITLKNIGNADATGVTISDPIPGNTTFVSADSTGASNGTAVTWNGLTVPAAGSVAVHLNVKIDPALSSTVTSIVDDGMAASSAQGQSTTGSPTVTPIAPPFALKVSPPSQVDGARVGNSVTYPLTITNLGFKNDSYTMSSSGGTFPVSFFGPDCTTPLAATPSVGPGITTTVCAKVSVPASAADSSTSTATVTATSVGSPSINASASIKTIAVAVNTLVVDDDSFVPSSSANVDVNTYYTTALTTDNIKFQLWDLGTDKNLPLNYLESFKAVVWFTGNSYPSPIAAYEPEVRSFLDGGGNLFLSGQDLLDQSGGTTPFVLNYLHVTWDGSETQNDKKTTHVNPIPGTLTDGVGSVPIDDTILQNDFMDEITPNGTATPIFTDDATKFDGLSFSGTYKVVFISFPMEEYGTAAQKADLVHRVFNFFGVS